jgi:hypothetical protein
VKGRKKPGYRSRRRPKRCWRPAGWAITESTDEPGSLTPGAGEAGLTWPAPEAPGLYRSSRPAGHWFDGSYVTYSTPRP